jgi:hypothetical protein
MINKFDAVSELLCTEAMKGTTIGEDMYERVSATLEK